MIQVPYDAISEEVLTSLAESFVLREGTDYGTVEISLEAKTDQVLRQIRKNEVLIFFDPESETVNLVSKNSPEYIHFRNKENL